MYNMNNKNDVTVPPSSLYNNYILPVSGSHMQDRGPNEAHDDNPEGYEIFGLIQ